MATRNLSEGPVATLVVTLALPVLGTVVLSSLYALADLYFVGRLGGAAQAGLGISLNTFYLVLAVGQSIGVGGLALMSQAFGRGDPARVGQLFQVMLWLSAGVGAAFAVAGTFSADAFIRAFTQDPEVQRQGVAFFRVYCITFFTQVMMVAFSFAFRAVGDFLVPAALMTLSVLLNVALDPLLIFGLGPVPGLGVAGAALATVLAQSAALVSYVWLVTGSRRRGGLLALRRPLVWEARAAWSIVRIGLPATLMFVLYTAVLLLVFRFLRPLGGAAAAAVTVGFRIVDAVLLPGMAIGAAVASLVGQNFGARLFSRARAAAKWGLFYATLAYSAGTGLLVAFPRFWVSLFAEDPAVVELGVQYLLIAGAVLPVYGMTIIVGNVCTGLGRTLGALAGPTARLGAVLVAMPVLESVFGLSAGGVFWVGVFGMWLDALAMAAVLLILWRLFLSAPDGPLAPPAESGALAFGAAQPLIPATQSVEEGSA